MHATFIQIKIMPNYFHKCHCAYFCRLEFENFETFLYIDWYFLLSLADISRIHIRSHWISLTFLTEIKLKASLSSSQTSSGLSNVAFARWNRSHTILENNWFFKLLSEMKLQECYIFSGSAHYMIKNLYFFGFSQISPLRY